MNASLIVTLTLTQPTRGRSSQSPQSNSPNSEANQIQTRPHERRSALTSQQVPNDKTSSMSESIPNGPTGDKSGPGIEPCSSREAEQSVKQGLSPEAAPKQGLSTDGISVRDGKHRKDYRFESNGYPLITGSLAQSVWAATAISGLSDNRARTEILVSNYPGNHNTTSSMRAAQEQCTTSTSTRAAGARRMDPVSEVKESLVIMLHLSLVALSLVIMDH